jgi:hypothetical protein
MVNSLAVFCGSKSGANPLFLSHTNTLGRMMAARNIKLVYNRYFMSAELPNSSPASRGADRETSKDFDYSLNNTITWDKVFNKDHHFTLTLVQEAESSISSFPDKQLERVIEAIKI